MGGVGWTGIIYSWIWLHRRKVCDPELCRAPHGTQQQCREKEGAALAQPQGGEHLSLGCF